jgi:hypothetical protein
MNSYVERRGIPATLPCVAALSICLLSACGADSTQSNAAAATGAATSSSASASSSSSSSTSAQTLTPPPTADSVALTGSPTTTATTGVEYTFMPSASGGNGTPLTFSISNKPSWATFSTVTGQLSGIPTAAGTFPSIVISATDGKASASLTAFAIVVSDPAQVADLCSGLTTGTSLMPYTSLPKPAKGQTVVDPDFGTKITRITDVQADWGATVAVPAYPTIPAWNADESLLVLYVTQPTKGWALLDGNTYAFKEWLPINPADIEQFYWDTKDPDLMYYVDNATEVLTRLHVSTGVKDSIHNFKTDIVAGPLKSACANSNLVSGGEDPFFMSFDNDLIGLGCRLNTNGPSGASNFVAFSYRLSTNTLGTTFTNEADVPQAAPSGTQTYFYSGSSGVKVLNPLTNAVQRTIAFDGTQHSDMLRNAAGDDMVAGVQYDGPSGSGTLMVANLSKGGVTTIIGQAKGDPYPPTGTLVSGKAFKQPGWVVIGVTGNGLNPSVPASTYLTQEILLANVDTGKVCRVAHHRSFGYDANSSNQNYWAQPNVVMSPRGTRILFPSDWYDGSTVDTYVVTLPSYQP